MTSKQQILRYLAAIITDNGRTFPMNTVSAIVRSATRLEIYSEFKAKLMRFWRGSRVDFIPTGYPKISGNGETLLLPADVQNKKDLYIKLIVATFNVETGSSRVVYGGQRGRQ